MERTKPNLIIKIILSSLILIVTAVLICGCAAEQTPYEINNSEGYTVSVKYDANGGIFTTNTSVIVDSFNPNDSSSVALLSPDDPQRGSDAFTATKAGHFLAGWYKEREEVSEGVYTYSGKWDFANDTITLDGDAAYTAEEPIMTLYAAWIPMFTVEFYSIDDGELLESREYDPTVDGELKVPEWNMESGAMELYDFPERSGYTFDAVYYDADATDIVNVSDIPHSGVIDYGTGTATDTVMKLYTKWVEGEWYHIYNTQQFVDNASVSGCYEIHADLDFTDEIWPTSFAHGNFNGVIKGNGHTFKNITFEQTDIGKVNSGLFGYLGEAAQLSDITFENVTFTIKAGTRKGGSCFGLFAGTISEDANVSNVSVLASRLQIDSAAFFGVEDYSIGLVCGMGDQSVLTEAQIEYKAVGDTPETVEVVINGYTGVNE